MWIESEPECVDSKGKESGGSATGSANMSVPLLPPGFGDKLSAGIAFFVFFFARTNFTTVFE
jgi:hypothetical protein